MPVFLGNKIHFLPVPVFVHFLGVAAHPSSVPLIGPRRVGATPGRWGIWGWSGERAPRRQLRWDSEGRWTSLRRVINTVPTASESEEMNPHLSFSVPNSCVSSIQKRDSFANKLQDGARGTTVQTARGVRPGPDAGAASSLRSYQQSSTGWPLWEVRVCT